MKQTRLSLLALAFVVAAMTAGCSRAHLGTHYGQAYGSWFTAQRVNAKPANADAARRIVESLDAGEAGMVSKSYRKGVSKGDDAAGSRMLMVGPQRGDVYVPPTSVPTP